jgi:hypothetical protein
MAAHIIVKGMQLFFGAKLYEPELRKQKTLGHAQGIAVEILFCGFAAKKIGAESPVFCLAEFAQQIRGAKKAPKKKLNHSK